MPKSLLLLHLYSTLYMVLLPQILKQKKKKGNLQRKDRVSLEVAVSHLMQLELPVYSLPSRKQVYHAFSGRLPPRRNPTQSRVHPPQCISLHFLSSPPSSFTSTHSLWVCNTKLMRQPSENEHGGESQVRQSQ